MGRRLRIVALGSVAAGAGLAILALLGLDFVAIEKAIATSFLITAAAVGTAVAAAAEGRPRPEPTHLAGGVAAVGAAAALVMAVWLEIDSELYWRLSATLFIVPALGLGLANVLSLADLTPDRRWVRGAADALAGALGLLVIGNIWLGEPFSVAWVQRLTGILAVLLAATAVAVPILHRAARLELAGVLARPAYCPFCGRDSAAELEAAAACPHCHHHYTVGSPAPPASPLLDVAAA